MELLLVLGILNFRCTIAAELGAGTIVLRRNISPYGTQTMDSGGYFYVLVATTRKLKLVFEYVRDRITRTENMSR